MVGTVVLRLEELQLIVFNAAKDGKLYKLKVFLEMIPRNKVALVVSAKTNCSTPLIMACRNGHSDVVRYLLEKCHTDIEQVGSVTTINGETVEFASPLWCATSAGHLHIVKILMMFKASLFCGANINSTPLHAACFYGHFDVVKYLVENGADIDIANRQDRTALMFACCTGNYEIAKYLLECGADVNRKCIKGSTALHDCIDSSSLAILKMLLKHGATLESDSWGTTPLLSAAIIGNTSIVDYFVEEYNCTKLEKVNALELLGATFIDRKNDMMSAYNCWRKAMQLRYEDSAFPWDKPCSSPLIANYFGVIEVHNFDQLEDLLSDPEKMRVQALLVRESILGQDHPETISCINDRAEMYARIGRFDQFAVLSVFAADVQQKIRRSKSEIIQQCLLNLTKICNYLMLQFWTLIESSSDAFFEHLYGVFLRVMIEIERNIENSVKQKGGINDTGMFDCTLVTAVHVIGLMCVMQPHLDKNIEMLLKHTVYKFVHLNLKTRNGWTPLHYACSKESLFGRSAVFTFPSPEVVDLLLEVGAFPNAIDSISNTPLHIAAMNETCPTAIFKSLLNYGAHIDLCNHERQTPLQLIQQAAVFDTYPLRYLSLQCLCAQVIQKNKIPYKSLVHKKLADFIYAH